MKEECVLRLFESLWLTFLFSIFTFHKLYLIKTTIFSVPILFLCMKTHNIILAIGQFPFLLYLLHLSFYLFNAIFSCYIFSKLKYSLGLKANRVLKQLKRQADAYKSAVESQNKKMLELDRRIDAQGPILKWFNLIKC